MNRQELKLKLAQGIYRKSVIVYSWDKENDSVRLHFFVEADAILDLVDGLGLELVERAVPKETKTTEVRARYEPNSYEEEDKKGKK